MLLREPVQSVVEGQQLLIGGRCSDLVGIQLLSLPRATVSGGLLAACPLHKNALVELSQKVPVFAELRLMLERAT